MIYKNNKSYEFVKADYLKYYEKLSKNSNVIKLLNFFFEREYDHKEVEKCESLTVKMRMSDNSAIIYEYNTAK